MNLNQLEYTSAVLTQILTFKQPADSVLSSYFRQNNKLGRQDRHEIAETAFVSLRHYQKISTVLPEPSKEARKAALAALVLGRGFNISQLENLIGSEDKDFLCRLKGLKADFLNQLNTAAELPQWLIDRLSPYYSEEAILQFGRSINQPAPLDVRVNTLKGKRDKILAELKSEGLEVSAMPYSPFGIRFREKIALNHHPRFLDGTLEVQDEGSQLLALLLGARRGDITVDFCAGAGGKTLAIGAMMANKGRIYAFDISEKRLANLKPRMVRAGLTNIHSERISSEMDARINRLIGKADRVLVDAPCSGLGTLRRNPDLKYRQSNDTITTLIEQQASILAQAAKLVNNNGRLVYATCSILPEENEQQVTHFLKNHPQWHLVDCGDVLNQLKINLNTGPYLKLNTAEHHTDGFFAAILEKNN